MNEDDRGTDIALISRGDAALLVGDSREIEALLVEWKVDKSEWSSAPTDVVRATVGAMEVTKVIAENSGVWLKLTKESAAAVKAVGGLQSTGDSAAIAAVLRVSKGKIFKHLRFEKATGLAITAPAVVAVIATQLANHQAQKELTDYLKTIDQKVERLLRENRADDYAEVAGISAAIDEAYEIYQATGRISETTWSKLQADSTRLHTAQAKALRKLGDLAEELQGRSDKEVDDWFKRDSEISVKFQLFLLATSIKLQDQLTVLELARVLDAGGEELDGHREGIELARARRRSRQQEALGGLLVALHGAGALPPSAKLASPFRFRRIVEGTNETQGAIAAYAQRAGLDEVEGTELDDLAWREAVGLVRDDTIAAADRVQRRARTAVESGVAIAANAIGDAARSAIQVGKALQSAIGAPFRGGRATPARDDTRQDQRNVPEAEPDLGDSGGPRWSGVSVGVFECQGHPPYTWDRVEIGVPESRGEPMGTKEKFWFDGGQHLFKLVRRGEDGRARGEDWAECLVHVVANLMGIPSACIMLASSNGAPGIVVRSVLGPTERLVHGNELLAKADSAYDDLTSRRNPSYTVQRIMSAVSGYGPSVNKPSWQASDSLATYLTLDALVAGRDRHHENWAAVERSGSMTRLAPSFDHGNALGFSEAPDRALEIGTDAATLAKWLAKGTSQHFPGKPTLIDVAVEALAMAPLARQEMVARLTGLDLSDFKVAVNAMPREILSVGNASLAIAVVSENRRRLLDALSS